MQAVFSTMTKGDFVKDLKPLIFFEDLLQSTDNELVRKEKEEGLPDLPGC